MFEPARKSRSLNYAPSSKSARETQPLQSEQRHTSVWLIKEVSGQIKDDYFPRRPRNQLKAFTRIFSPYLSRLRRGVQASDRMRWRAAESLKDRIKTQLFRQMKVYYTVIVEFLP